MSNELIEKLQKIIEREIDNVPMVLTDPLTLRRLRAERLAQAALTALIEHAGQDGVTETQSNVGRCDMDEDELADYIGRRVLADADKLRLFMPDCYARFPLEWCGYDYEVQVILKGKTDDVPN